MLRSLNLCLVLDPDDCEGERNRCKNGGLCMDREYHAECFCTGGFYGDTCEGNIELLNILINVSESYAKSIVKFMSE